jgi:hypothetical protein
LSLSRMPKGVGGGPISPQTPTRARCCCPFSKSVTPEGSTRQSDGESRQAAHTLLHTSAYVSQHTSAYVSIRQPAYVSIRQPAGGAHAPARASAYVSVRQHTSAYVSIREHTHTAETLLSASNERQHTSAYASIRQHTSAYGGDAPVGIERARLLCTSAYVSIRQHTSAYVSIRRRRSCRHRTSEASVYVSIRQHTSAYVSIRQHTSAYVSIRRRRSCRHRTSEASVQQLPLGWRLRDARSSARPIASPGAHLHERQHASAHASIRQHTSAYVSIRQHTSATAASIRRIQGVRTRKVVTKRHLARLAVPAQRAPQHTRTQARLHVPARHPVAAVSIAAACEHNIDVG